MPESKPPTRIEDTAEEEIEILEIVGVDEDPEASPSRGRSEDDGSAEDDIVVEFEAEAEPVADGLSDSDRLARLTIDFENLRRRVDREREAQQRQAAAQLIERLLPVLDNFERALAAARDHQADRALQDGVAMIFRQLLDALRREGLAAVDSVGEPFDPEVHEAVATAAASELPANTVVEELQRGYLLHDRLLRPALVRVSVGESTEES
jgi:molecular chaperone GrpE